MDIRTTWRQPETAIVHGVTIAGLHLHVVGIIHGTPQARQIADLRTDCGLVPQQVSLTGAGPVCCVPCLEAHGDIPKVERDERVPGFTRLFEREPVAS